MKKNSIYTLSFIVLVIFGLSQCKKDRNEKCPTGDCDETPTTPVKYGTPYNFVVPEGFPAPFIPADNPMTVEGVELGRYLFYDKRLSKDLTMSCGSCHKHFNYFSDITPRSIGVHGQETPRNSMPLFNLAWQEKFFWDGRSLSLEEQALEPVTNMIELDNDWETVVSRFSTDSIYPSMFEAAFGPNSLTKENVAKAIAQFERTFISASSEFDSVARLKIKPFRNPGAQRALEKFGTERFDCFHCHGVEETQFLLGAFGTDGQFKNNGLLTEQEMLTDNGREAITGNSNDRGAFKVPSLRNLTYTGPYMHDGRIPYGLDSLIEFYNFGGHPSSSIDDNMKAAGVGREWTNEEKEDLKALLRSMNDRAFQENEAFSDPFE